MKSSFNTWTSGDTQALPWQHVGEWDLNYFPWPWTMKDWQELAQSPRHYFLLWHDDAGFALWELDGSPAAYLLKILVRPKFRGEGYGHQLMSLSEQWLSEQGFDLGLLEVQWDNSSAISLYESLGWQQSRRISAFYRDGSDAISMQKSF